MSNNSYVENGLQIFFNGIFLLVYAFLQEIPWDFNRNISRMRIHPSTSTCHSRSARQTFILRDVAYLRLLISVIIHSQNWKTRASNYRSTISDKDRENLRRTREKWRIHALFNMDICSINVESENNLDVYASRCWMRRGHQWRDEDDQEKSEKTSWYTKTEDEQPDKLFLQGGIHNGSEGLYHGVESQ